MSTSGAFRLRKLQLRPTNTDVDVVTLVSTADGVLTIGKNSDGPLLSAGVDAFDSGVISVHVMTSQNRSNVVSNLSVSALLSSDTLAAGQLSVARDMLIGGNLLVDVLIAQSASVSGILSVGGASLVGAGGGLSVAGASGLLVAGAFDTAGSLSTAGTLSAGSDVSIGGALDLSGSVSTGGLVTGGGGVAMPGDLSVHGASALLGGPMLIDGAATLTGASTLAAGATLSGALSVASGAAMAGSVSVSAAATFGGAVHIAEGGLVVASGVSVGGASAVLGGDVHVASGATTLEGALTAGSVSTSGSTSVGGNVVATGGLTAAAGTSFLGDDLLVNGSSIVLAGPVSIGGDAAFAGALSVGQTAYIAGHVSVASGLSVAGAGTFDVDVRTTSLSVAGGSTFGGAASALATFWTPGSLTATTAPVIVGGTLSIGGDATTVAGAVSIGGSLSVSGAWLSVSGAASIAGELRSEGTGVLTSSLSVSGAARFASTLQIDGDLVVTGTQTLIDTTELDIVDPVIAIGSESDPTLVDIGFTIGSTSDKRFIYHHPHFGVYDSATTLGDFRSMTLGVGTALGLDEPLPTSVYFSGTDAVKVPAGSIEQRPVAAENGMVRYNTTESILETFISGSWVAMGAPRTPDGRTRIDATADALSYYVNDILVARMTKTLTTIPVLSVSAIHAETIAAHTPDAGFSFDEDARFTGDLTVRGDVWIQDATFTASGTELTGTSVVAALSVEASPTEGSTNLVESSGVFSAMLLKQNAIAWSTTATSNSDAPITSGGVWQTLQDITPTASGIDVAWAFEDTSGGVGGADGALTLTIAWSSLDLNSSEYMVNIVPRHRLGPRAFDIVREATRMTISFLNADRSAFVHGWLADVDISVFYRGSAIFAVSCAPRDAARLTPSSDFYTYDAIGRVYPYDAAKAPTGELRGPSGGALLVLDAAALASVTFENDARITGVDLTYIDSAPIAIPASMFRNADLSSTGIVELSSLQSATISVGSYAFADTTLPPTLTLPASARLDAFAFSGADVHSVDVASGATLGASAFANSTLQRVRLAASATPLPASCFSGASQLLDVQIEEVNAMQANSGFASTPVDARIWSTSTDAARGYVKAPATFAPGRYVATAGGSTNQYDYFRPLEMDGTASTYYKLVTASKTLPASYTFSAWVRTNSPFAARTIWTLGTDDGSRYVTLGTDGTGRAVYSVYEGGVLAGSASALHPTLSTDEYFFVSVVVTSGLAPVVYTKRAGDASLTASAAGGAIFAHVVSDGYVHARLGAPMDLADTGAFWNGDIAEVYMWGVAVSASALNAFADTRVGAYTAVDGAETSTSRLANSRPYVAAAYPVVTDPPVSTLAFRVDEFVPQHTPFVPASAGSYVVHPGVVDTSAAGSDSASEIDLTYATGLRTISWSNSFQRRTFVDQVGFVLPAGLLTVNGGNFQGVYAYLIRIPKSVTTLNMHYFFAGARVYHIIFDKASTPSSWSVSTAWNFQLDTSSIGNRTINLANRFSLFSHAISSPTLQRFTTLVPISVTSSDGGFRDSVVWRAAFPQGSTISAGVYVRTSSTTLAYFDGSIAYAFANAGETTVRDLATTAPTGAHYLVIGSSVVHVNPRSVYHATGVPLAVIRACACVDFSIAQAMETLSGMYDLRGVEDVLIPNYRHVTCNFAMFDVGRTTSASVHMHIPERCEFVGQCPNNTSIKSLSFASTVHSGASAMGVRFTNWTGLWNVDLGTRFVELVSGMFSGCTSLRRLVVRSRSFRLADETTMSGTKLASFFANRSGVDFDGGIYETADNGVSFTYAPLPSVDEYPPCTEETAAPTLFHVESALPLSSGGVSSGKNRMHNFHWRKSYDDAARTGTIVVASTATSVNVDSAAASALDLTYASSLTTLHASGLTLSKQRCLMVPSGVTDLPTGMLASTTGQSGLLRLPATLATMTGTNHFASNTWEHYVFTRQVVGEGNVVLPANALASATGCRTINLGNRVGRISSNALLNLASLERLTILRSGITIDAGAFNGVAAPWPTLGAARIGPHATGLFWRTGASTIAYFDGSTNYAYCAAGSEVVRDLLSDPPASGTQIYVCVGSYVASLTTALSSYFQRDNILGLDFSLATSLTSIGASSLSGLRNLTHLVLPEYATTLTLASGTQHFESIGSLQPSSNSTLLVPSNLDFSAASACFASSACFAHVVFECASSTSTMNITLGSGFFSNATTLLSIDFGDRISGVTGSGGASGASLAGCSSLIHMTWRRSWTLPAPPSSLLGTPFAAVLGASAVSTTLNLPAGVYEVVAGQLSWYPLPYANDLSTLADDMYNLAGYSMYATNSTPASATEYATDEAVGMRNAENAAGVLYVSSSASATGMPSYAFDADTQIRGVNFQDAVTAFGVAPYAFRSTDLTSALMWPASPKTLTAGAGAFALTTLAASSALTVPSNVYLGASAFDGSTGVSRLTVANLLSLLGPGTFANISTLQRVRLGAGRSALLGSDFQNSDAVVDVQIDGLTLTLGSNSITGPMWSDVFSGPMWTDVFASNTNSSRGYVASSTFAQGRYIRRGTTSFDYFRPLEYFGAASTQYYRLEVSPKTLPAVNTAWCMWVRPNDFESQRTIVTLYNSATTYMTLHLSAGGTQLVHSAYASGTLLGQNTMSITPPSTSEFFFVALSCWGNTTMYYKPAGAANLSMNTASFMYTGDVEYEIRIGVPVNHVSNASQIWSGEIAEVYLWHSPVGEPDLNAFAATRVGSQDSVDLANKIGNSRPYKVMAQDLLLRGGTSRIYTSSLSPSGYLFVDGTQTEIAESSYQNATNVLGAFIPNSISSLGANSFANISGWTMPSFSAPKAALGNNAFLGLPTNGVIHIPNTATIVGSLVFSQCAAKNLVCEPAAQNQSASTGVQMFKDCASLQTICVGNRFTHFNQSFQGCTSLRRFACLQPFTGTSLFQNVAVWSSHFSGGGPFPAGLYILTGSTITYVSGNEYDYIHVSPTGTVSNYLSNPNIAGTLVIGSSVSSIAASAFYYHDFMSDVDFSLATALTSIGASAFMGCLRLSNLVFPMYNDVQLGNDSFRNTTGNIGHVFFPKNIKMTNLQYDTFVSSTISSAVFEKTATEGTEIFKWAFLYGISALQYVDIGNRFDRIERDAFNSSSNMTTFISHRAFTVLDSRAFSGTKFQTTNLGVAQAQGAGIYESVNSVYSFTPFSAAAVTGAQGTATVTI